MLDRVSSPMLAAAMDGFYEEQIHLESAMNSLRGEAVADGQMVAKISQSVENFLKLATQNVSPASAAWDALCKAIQGHPVHARHIMQSAMARRAYEKPLGYAGDMGLMRLICEINRDQQSSYADCADLVYLSLPAAEAVRQRIEGIQHILGALPEGSRVLCLACGPAIEFQKHFTKGGPGLSVDLLDHDPQTIAFTISKLPSSQFRHVVANAFDIVKGVTAFSNPANSDNAGDFRLETESYDLVYSMGLYDYVQTFPMNPNRGTTGLTKRLFDLVKPGGRLIVGNFLTPGGTNAHSIAHRLVMEAFADWRLIYRSAEDVAAFASTIPRERFTARMLDQTLSAPLSPSSVIGFLELTAR